MSAGPRIGLLTLDGGPAAASADGIRVDPASNATVFTEDMSSHIL